MKHQCPHCDYFSNRPGNLTRHIECKHPSEEDKHPAEECICTICRKAFTNKFCRDRHYNTKCIHVNTSIYNFDHQRIFPVKELCVTGNNLDQVPVQDRVYTLARELITQFFQLEENRNIYIVKGFCYVFTGIEWVKTREADTLHQLSNTFVLSVLHSLSPSDRFDKITNDTLKEWYTIFTRNAYHVYSKEFLMIKDFFKEQVCKYSLEKFPTGYFKKIRRQFKNNSNININELLRRKEQERRERLMGFAPGPDWFYFKNNSTDV